MERPIIDDMFVLVSILTVTQRCSKTQQVVFEVPGASNFWRIPNFWRDVKKIGETVKTNTLTVVKKEERAPFTISVIHTRC